MSSGLQAGDRAARERDRARVGREHAGDQVERRGLAGAVRADQRVQRAVRAPTMSTPSTAWMPPKLLARLARDQHRAVACAGGRRSAAAAARPRDASRPAMAAASTTRLRNGASSALGDADEAGRREHDEADEQQAELEQPVRRPDRQEFAEQDEEQRAERRPEERAHAADHHHGQQLAGERDRDRLGRGEAVVEHRQRAGERR